MVFVAKGIAHILPTFARERASPRAVATASRSSSKRSAYVSRVIAADLCPSILWTAFTFAPDEIASDAAVCLRSWIVTRGK
jgi:hypothetical protein